MNIWDKYKKYIEEFQIEEITVWLLSLKELAKADFSEMYECCDAGRKEKADKIKAEKKWQQCIGAGYLLALLKEKFFVESEVVCLPDGKPVFREDNGVYFNISHSGNFVALAYGERPLGVDLESVRRARENVAKRFFTEEEYHAVMEKEGTERDSIFFKIWTGKEAVVKAAGAGLKISPDSFSVMQEKVELCGKQYILLQNHMETNGEKIWLSAAWEV